MADKEKPPFETHEQAIEDLQKILLRRHQHRDAIRLTGTFPDSGRTMEQEYASIDRSHARAVMKWKDRAAGLGTPWSLAHIDALFTPGIALGKELAATTSAIARRNLQRQVLPCAWVVLSDPSASRKLLRLLVEEIGVPPHRYFGAANITLLGMSAYTSNIPALRIMLGACSPPESRLVTQAHHLSDKASSDSWLIDSTLLHRVAQQHISISGDPEEADRLDQAKKVLGLMIKHDPECQLTRNIHGHLPEEMAPLSPIGDWLEQQRVHYQSQSRRTQLKAAAGDIRSPRPLATSSRL